MSKSKKDLKSEKEFTLELYQYYDKAGRFNESAKEYFIDLFGTADIQNIIYDDKTSSFVTKVKTPIYLC